MNEIGAKIGKNEPTSIEDLPSYEKVKNFVDLRYEVNSLIPIKMLPTSLMMNKAEVTELIEAHGGSLKADEKVPCFEGPSMFLSLFPAEVPAVEVPNEVSPAVASVEAS